MRLPEFLLEKIRCPHCAKAQKGLLTPTGDHWLICGDCERKYPSLDGLPVLTIQEGDKWLATPADALPAPSPAGHQSAYDRS